MKNCNQTDGRRDRTNTLRDNDWDWIGRTEQNLKIVDGYPNVSILLPIWSYHDCKMKDAVFKSKRELSMRFPI